ncbi:MAG: hypothetical protein QNK37_05110 [Acidobacteriota bacterium]|nr:hypothetical protein [Acidobacteriota bacterium]
MFKKLSLCVSLLAVLGLGVSQWNVFGCTAGFVFGQTCCPATYQGKPFLVAADFCNGVITCYYDYGFPSTLSTSTTCAP